MIADDFLSLALKLSTEPGEAEKRSAVSRAYYAVFHQSLHFLKQFGVHFSQSAEAHKKIALCLFHSGDAGFVITANELEALRRFRNLADYELANSKFKNAGFIQLQLGTAQELYSRFSATRQNLPAIRQAVRAYARDVLKMSVQGVD